jgi:multiple sugar transport system substrate-binding protein
MRSTKNVADLMQAMGGVPGRKSSAPMVDLYKEGGPLSLYLAQLNAGVGYPRPAHPAYPTITASFAKAVADIIDGKDVKASLDEAAKKIDQDISDNKGYPPFGKA